MIDMKKPKFGEEYYYLILDKTTDKATVKAKKKKWEDSNFDNTMFFVDNIYESENAAEADKGRFDGLIELTSAYVEDGHNDEGEK